MEKNTDDNTTLIRKGKSVRFNQEPQVFVFERQSNDVSESKPTIRSPVMRTEQGSVRERVRRYDQNVAWRSIPLRPRPPALPPRNPVQVPVKEAAPKPPPRSNNESAVDTNVRPKVRVFRRCPNPRPVTEGREVVPLVPHYRMKVPDKPPPPPPSLVPLVPLSAAATPSTSSTPSTPSADDDDDGIRPADPTNAAQADGDDDNDQDDRPGCMTGCFLFIFGCCSCIIG